MTGSRPQIRIHLSSYTAPTVGWILVCGERGIVITPSKLVLQGDIVASLKSRLELLVDEAEEAEEDARMQEQDADYSPPPETLLSSQLR